MVVTIVGCKYESNSIYTIDTDEFRISWNPRLRKSFCLTTSVIDI